MLGDDLAPVRRALISVSDKSGVVSFAQALSDLGIEILSTGGTASLLRQEGIPVIDVSAHTGFPEMMGGRIKTLHPHIHGGILGRRGIDDATMSEAGIVPIDLVVVNLYPFEQTITSPDATREEAIENIDIGGPAMIRAAAKNHQAVTVIVDSNEYPVVVAELRTNNGISSTMRRRLATAAFAETARYDSIISDYLLGTHTEDNLFPEILGLQFLKHSAMRYGENPHQAAAAYKISGDSSNSVLNAKIHQGKKLSYNNIMDADAAFSCLKEFEETACVIVKHANPCGVSKGENMLEVYKQAFNADSRSAFGGIVAMNKKCDELVAEEISKVFVEIVLAPSFTKEALGIFSKKKNLRVLEVGNIKPREKLLEVRNVVGGIIVQETDTSVIQKQDLTTVTTISPSESEIETMLFGWKVLKHIKSNGILIVKDNTTLGVGAGQVSRVDSFDIAMKKS